MRGDDGSSVLWWRAPESGAALRLSKQSGGPALPLSAALLWGKRAVDPAVSAGCPGGCCVCISRAVRVVPPRRSTRPWCSWAGRSGGKVL